MAELRSVRKRRYKLVGWVCEGYQQDAHIVSHPMDRTEVKVEVLRSGDHGRRFHSKLLHHYCRECARGWWEERFEKGERVAEEALF